MLLPDAPDKETVPPGVSTPNEPTAYTEPGWTPAKPTTPNEPEAKTPAMPTDMDVDRVPTLPVADAPPSTGDGPAWAAPAAPVP